MKKHVFGRQLSRDINERKALFKGLINALVLEESIKTTQPKAKAIKGEVEKLITKAKRKGDGAKSLLQPWLSPEALEKVLKDLSVRFAQRPGGYTRIVTLGERFGDNATMAIIEFVEKKEVVKETKETKGKNEAKGKVEATVKTARKTRRAEPLGSAPSAPKKENQPKESKKAGQRPPSRSEKRKGEKGSPKKESK